MFESEGKLWFNYYKRNSVFQVNIALQTPNLVYVLNEFGWKLLVANSRLNAG